MLFSVILLKKGVELYKSLCRLKGWTVRPYFPIATPSHDVPKSLKQQKAQRERGEQVEKASRREQLAEENQLSKEQQYDALKKQLQQNRAESWKNLLTACKTEFPRAFSAWVHVKAMRLHVEAVLRYGLPSSGQQASFVGFLLQPADEKRARKALDTLYEGLTADKSLLAADAGTNATEKKEDLFAYVSLTLDV